MADIQTNQTGKGRRKIRAPRVDLTPMVDLGFLLITFFMFTTTLAKPKVMELQMPYVPEEPARPTKIPAEATLVILPTADHRIAWYNGLQDPGQMLHWCGFSGDSSLRRLLSEESARVQALPASFSKEAHKLHVIIKPDRDAAYDDLVQALDEMVIGAVPYYTMLRPEAHELDALKKFRAARYGK